jgi:hypothetical protein
MRSFGAAYEIFEPPTVRARCLRTNARVPSQAVSTAPDAVVNVDPEALYERRSEQIVPFNSKSTMRAARCEKSLGPPSRCRLKPRG